MSRKNYLFNKSIPKPKIGGEYVNIYMPQGRVYESESSNLNFNKDEYYDTWIVNDHGFVKAQDGWHIFGITQPKSAGFNNDYNFNENVHCGEIQLFHAYGKGKLKDLLYDDSFEECALVLRPQDRPDEICQCHAPHIIKWNKKYRIIYGPTPIRYAESDDLYNFESKGVLFNGSPSTRDPNVFIDDDNKIYIFYAVENRVAYRISKDMINWSEEKTIQVNPYTNGTCESPFVFKKDGIYYLMWCIWDKTCGCYDHRTFVFGSKSIEGLKEISPLTILDAHAPEIVIDEEKNYYITSAFYPNNGINIAPLKWEI